MEILPPGICVQMFVKIDPSDGFLNFYHGRLTLTHIKTNILFATPK